MRKIINIALAAVILIAGGCLKEQRELRLKSDLSGTFSMRVLHDFNLLTEAIIRLKAGNLSPEQAALMKQQVKQQTVQEIKNQMKEKGLSGNRAQVEKNLNLPEGINLINFTVKIGADKMIVFIKIGFKHVKDLKGMDDFKLSKILPYSTKGQEKMLPGMSEVMEKTKDKNFMDIKVTESGNTLRIKFAKDFEDLDQMTQQIDQLENMTKLMPGMGEIFNKLLKGSKSHYRVRLPHKRYKLVKENSHKRIDAKNTLYWFYNMDRMIADAKKKKKPALIDITMKKR